jgi:hypothetical protein
VRDIDDCRSVREKDLLRRDLGVLDINSICS